MARQGTEAVMGSGMGDGVGGAPEWAAAWHVAEWGGRPRHAARSRERSAEQRGMGADAALPRWRRPR
jgi:hypothetical protein